MLDHVRGSRGSETSALRVTQLDGLRGLAALGVMVFHYQHFGGNKAHYPWVHTAIAGWLYVHGWLLVDFFFLLSGVVITRRYLDLVATRRLSGRAFLWLRLSRIYPLHLLALVLVAALQWSRVWFGHAYLIYPQNDLYHFVLNLGLLHSGMLEDTFSFNGPSWSIGVEMIAYLAFFQLAKLRAVRFTTAALLAFIAGLIVCSITLSPASVTTIGSYPLVNGNVGRCLTGFFCGSLCYVGLRRAAELGLSRRIGFIALAAFAAVIAAGMHFDADAFIGGDGSRAALHYGLTVFPLVLVAALEVRPLASFLSLWPFRHLGDISYTLYMLHVPVQLSVLTYAEWHHLDLPTARPAFLAAYVAVVLVLATLTHRFIEVPARSWLRGWLPSSAAEG